MGAAALALAHGFDGRPRAHVRNVNVTAGHLGQQDVAAGGDGLCHAGNAAQSQRRRHRPFMGDAVALQGLILAMLDHRHVEHAGVLERATRQDCRRHRQAIVGHRHAAGFLQLGDVGQLFALLSARHGADWIDAGQVCFRRLLQDQPRDPGVVVHRPGVRHARHGRESAGHRRGDAGRDGLFMLLTGLAKVHMHVDQSGAHDEAGWNVDDFSAVGLQVGSHFGNAIAVDQHVENAVAAVGRVNDATSLEQAFHRRSPSKSVSNLCLICGCTNLRLH
jgi:hypothetical protein